MDDSGGEPVWSADKTFAEIESAIEAGQHVYGRAGGMYVNLALADENSAQFTSIDVTPLLS